MVMNKKTEPETENIPLLNIGGSATGSGGVWLRYQEKEIIVELVSGFEIRR